MKDWLKKRTSQGAFDTARLPKPYGFFLRRKARRLGSDAASHTLITNCIICNLGFVINIHARKDWRGKMMMTMRRGWFSGLPEKGHRSGQLSSYFILDRHWGTDGTLAWLWPSSRLMGEGSFLQYFFSLFRKSRCVVCCSFYFLHTHMLVEVEEESHFMVFTKLFLSTVLVNNWEGMRQKCGSSPSPGFRGSWALWSYQ